MLNIILMLLAISYIAINLVLFGSALVMMSFKDSLKYLFFGTLIIANELWKK
jgi:hypothetical protein